MRRKRPFNWIEKLLQKIPTWLFIGGVVAILSAIAVWLDPDVHWGANYKEIFRVIFNNAESISIAALVGLYFKQIPDRKAQKHYEAWQVIDNAAAAQVPTSYARNTALQDLCRDGVPLDGLDVPNTDLERIQLPGAIVRHADFRGTILRHADLREADLSYAKFAPCGGNRGADLRSAKLQKANLQGANLQAAILFNAKLQSADLTGADLRGADLREAQLEGASLSGAELQGAKLLKTNFQGADLSYCNFGLPPAENSNKTDSSKTMSSVLGVPEETKEMFKEIAQSFSKYVKDTYPSDPKRFYVDLSNTNLNDCDLSHANLSQTRLQQSNLTKAKLCWTILPEELKGKIDPNRNCVELGIDPQTGDYILPSGDPAYDYSFIEPLFAPFAHSRKPTVTYKKFYK